MPRPHIPAKLRRLVVNRAGGQCEYCLIHQDDRPETHPIDHVIALKHGGRTVKENIDKRIRAFRSQHGRLLAPLRIPVALEVIIKPPPTRNHALHDLDNVMRTYLVPKVTELLEPPSDIAWTYDRSVFAQHDGDHGIWLRNRLEKLPRSARVGLIRCNYSAG